MRIIEVNNDGSSFLFQWQLLHKLVVMGSPHGPLFTTVAFFFHHKRNSFRDCLIEYALIFYKIMDDIVVLLKFENHANMLLSYLNFTLKSNLHMRTVDKSLVCFEFNFHRCNNSFEISVHLKWTFSGVYTNYRSLIATVYRSSFYNVIEKFLITIYCTRKL